MGFTVPDSHRNALPIPDKARNDPKGVEIARIWATGGKQVVVLRADAWENPAAWGLMLVDFAKHVANAYAELGKGDRENILQQIKMGFDMEWNSPTDEPIGGMAK